MEELQNDAFTAKRVELMIEMATKKFHGEIAMLKGQVEGLNSQVGHLKNQVTKFENQQVQKETLASIGNNQQNVVNQVSEQKSLNEVHQEVSVEAASPSVAQANPAPKPAAKPNDSRYGNFTSEDVSIDKFFSFGR